MNETLSQILEHYPTPTPDLLIPVLQDIQEAVGFLPADILTEVSLYLNVPLSRIYGVATFYNQFRLHPSGKYHIQVCRGTACHVYGSIDLLDILQNELGISNGETSEDQLFSLEIVSCIGICGLAPVLTVNGEVYSRVTPKRLKELLQDFRNNNHAK